MDRLISLQAAIDEIKALYEWRDTVTEDRTIDHLKRLPPVQPEIIRCKDCKHWTRTYGDDRWGLGDCDVFDKHLVMSEGYCAWAERRTDD